MNDTDNVRRVAPERLSTARDLAHKAVQMVSKAARANLAPVPDDSHSNLGWDRKRGAFLSQPIAGMNGAYFIGFAVSDFELIFTCDGDKIATRCIAGDTDADAADWLDAQLANTGLEPTASTTLPYDLPASVERIGTYEIGAISEDLKALTSWFMLADKVLVAFAEKYRDLEPGPGPLRC